MWNFRRPGENGMERTPSDAAAILFFLRKEREKNGAQKHGGHCPPIFRTGIGEMVGMAGVIGHAVGLGDEVHEAVGRRGRRDAL